jgi:tripeptide aminopeptidase
MATYTSSLAEQLAPDLLDRFLRYVRVATQSDRDSTTTPSTAAQKDLSNLLRDELQQLGLADAAVDEGGYVYATLPASGWTAPTDPPVVGLIAHVDTSPDAPGDGVEPLVHRDYDGTAIALPKNGTVLDPQAMPELQGKQGHDIVTSSGDTLLGADDKAGVAEIMAAVAHLVANPDVPRPTLRIGFTVDEEIGRGGLGFDVERFGARCAYTIDGSELGELQDETFTAAEATITIEGIDVHSGFATGKLVNAARLAAQVLAALPSDRLTPETTQGREGFIHPYEISGTPGRATIVAIVRDFEEELLEQHVALLRTTAEQVVAREPRARLQIDVKRQYPNMRDHLAATPEVVELAERALRAEGLTPVRTPIRGGTDGSLLSARGLPTPNLFTGGHEYHSVREWASLQEMAASAATIVRLAEAWAASPQL